MVRVLLSMTLAMSLNHFWYCDDLVVCRTYKAIYSNSDWMIEAGFADVIVPCVRVLSQ